MSQPYIGEIRLFGGNFAPAGWMHCEGQLLPISENDALFTLIGTTYGGDGQETFGLPDLRGRIPLHQGQGPGISQNYQMGEMSGTETVTLTTQQIPGHRHPPLASAALASSTTAAGNIPASWPDAPYRTLDGAAPVPLAPESVAGTGGSQPHENMPPFLGINYIISLFGIFPSQT